MSLQPAEVRAREARVEMRGKRIEKSLSRRSGMGLIEKDDVATTSVLAVNMVDVMGERDGK